MGGATADVEEEEEVEEVEEEVVAAVVEEEEVVFFDFEAALPMILVARTRPAIGVTRRAAERMMEKCIFFFVSQFLISQIFFSKEISMKIIIKLITRGSKI